MGESRKKPINKKWLLKEVEIRFATLQKIAKVLPADGEFHQLTIFRLDDFPSALFVARGKGKDKVYKPGLYHYWDDRSIYGPTNAVPDDCLLNSGKELMKILGKNVAAFLHDFR